MTNSNRHSEVQARGVTGAYVEEVNLMWGAGVQSGSGATLSIWVTKVIACSLSVILNKCHQSLELS